MVDPAPSLVTPIWQHSPTKHAKEMPMAMDPKTTQTLLKVAVEVTKSLISIFEKTSKARREENAKNQSRTD
jgi:hypothetical protein